MALDLALGAAGIAIGLVALVVAVIAWARAARLRRTLTAVREERAQAPAAPTPPTKPAVRASPVPDPHAIRNVAIVRYDALQEMGGRLSFSLALLDSAGEGVVLSSINGRTETRTYAKVIRGGEASHPLSPEEERAVREARHGRDPGRRTGDGRTGENGTPEVSTLPRSERSAAGARTEP